MSFSARRGFAVIGVAALTLGAPATAFAAGHGGHGGHGKAGTHHSHKHHGKPAPARFTATGTFDAADASGLTFTMDDKGGSKDLHGKAGVVITVSSKTKVTRDDATATLAQLVAGDHVAVNGLRGANGELDALHVNAESAPAPDPTATAQSTDSPDPQSTDSPDPQSTDSPAPQPTDTSSPVTTTSP